MANIYCVVFVWLSLFTICYSLTVTGSRDDEGEYEDFADIESSTEKECFFKASLVNCKKGKVLKTYVVEKDTNKGKKDYGITIGDSTSKVCLKALCTYNSAGDPTAVSETIRIGGVGEEANPDNLQKGVNGNVFKSSRECMKKGEVYTTITCVKMKKSNPATSGGTAAVKEQMMEQEMIQMQTEEDSSPPDNEDDKNDALEMAQDGGEEDGDTDDEETAMQQDDSYDIPADGQEVDLKTMKANVQEGTTAKIQWNNWFRHTMHVNCGNRNGLYLARSGHSRYYKDRIWSFGCKRISCYNFNHCYWTGYLNFYDAPLLAQCRVNYIMTGMYSHYHNSYGDRMFQLLCCRAPRHHTRNGGLSGYVNGYRGFMHWGVGGNYVFNGALSIHNNHHEDRVWRFAYTRYTR